MHNRLFWRRRDWSSQTTEAIEETRKRYSVYSFLPPRVKGSKVEATATPAIANEVKSEEGISKVVKEESKAEPAGVGSAIMIMPTPEQKKEVTEKW